MRNRISIIINLIFCAISSLAQKPSFPYPIIPDSLKTIERRMEHLCLHYWDDYDFADTLQLHDANITEQGFVNYIDLLPHLSKESARNSVSGFAKKAFTMPSSKSKFESLIEHYFDDPQSPMRNDMIYLLFLRNMQESSLFDETEKERIEYKIKRHNKNLPGNTALNFSFMGKDGKPHQLSDYKQEKVILYFYDPDCENCHRTSAWLSQQSIPQEYQIVMVHADDEISDLYSLQAMPTIYLLDKENQVILKDCSAQKLIEHLVP